MHSLPDTLFIEVNNALLPGERIVWAGQPIPGGLAWRNPGLFLTGISCIAFTLAWLGFACGFSLNIFFGGFHWYHPFGALFLLIGIAQATVPYQITRAAMQTAYVVTNRRAIVFEGRYWGATIVRSYLPNQLTQMRRPTIHGGTDLVFEIEKETDIDNVTFSIPRGFLAVDDVTTAETMVRQLCNSATAAKP